MPTRMYHIPHWNKVWQPLVSLKHVATQLLTLRINSITLLLCLVNGLVPRHARQRMLHLETLNPDPKTGLTVDEIGYQSRYRLQPKTLDSSSFVGACT